MGRLRVRLFGRFEVRHEQETVLRLEPRKAQELLAYLLLYNGRPHPRERLANMMWPTSKARQARKHLRHTLWELRSAVDSAKAVDSHDLLSSDPDWLRLNPEAHVWIDVKELEHAYARTQGVSGSRFDSGGAQAVQRALDLYRGDLLEGWYEEWCLFERERLQGMHLALLGKQMTYYEAHRNYELGLDCGIRALRCDVAYERIHRHMMRLRYLAGDRTGALRQYQRCVAFLRQELEVEPSARTMALYERIRADVPLIPRGERRERDLDPETEDPVTQTEALEQLEQLRMASLQLQRQLQDTIEAFQVTLQRQS